MAIRSYNHRALGSKQILNQMYLRQLYLIPVYLPSPRNLRVSLHFSGDSVEVSMESRRLYAFFDLKMGFNYLFGRQIIPLAGLSVTKQ